MLTIPMNGVRRIEIASPTQCQTEAGEVFWIRRITVSGHDSVRLELYADRREQLLTPIEAAAEAKLPTEAEIQSALDFGKTAEQHLLHGS